VIRYRNAIYYEKEVVVSEQPAWGASEDQPFRDHNQSLDEVTQLRSRHIGRFSEGMEQLPTSPRKMRHGRFSDGIARLSEVPAKLHVGRFSEGIEQLPETTLRRGSFADGLEARQRARQTSPARRLHRAA
jgi:hypothetical protein